MVNYRFVTFEYWKKLLTGNILPAITDMVNQSLEIGVFPTSLKSAMIIPTLKKPSLDPEELKNFRPISNLPFLGKIMERAVCMQLMAYLTSNSLLPSRQSAYRRHHSVETALVRVYNDLLQSLDKQQEAVLILLDMTAAFDTVDHQILLSRLNNRFGVTGVHVALNWFSSYSQSPFKIHLRIHLHCFGVCPKDL